MTTRGTRHGSPRGCARAATVLLVAAMAGLVVLPCAGAEASNATGAGSDSARADSSHRSDPARDFLEARVRSDPDDSTAWNRLGALELAAYRREGDFAELRAAERAASESLRAVPAEANRAGLALRARVAQASHRFDAARQDAERLTDMAPAEAEGWRLLTDVRIELGDMEGARKAAEEQARLEPRAVATELCLARLAMELGNAKEARRGLAAVRAQAEAASPPDAELIAWCRVQDGRLAFSSGDLDAAERAFRGALLAWPGWYAAEDRLAETLAARGNFDGALVIYRPLAERLRRPEIWQAFGDVLMAAGRGKDAVEWYERARVAYLASAESGELLYLHHLSGFFCDVMPDPASALRWARRDLETRRSMGAWDALGRALHRAGRPTEALVAERRALEFPASARDAHVLLNAAAICRVAGEAARAKEYLDAALAVNPRCGGFHVHR